MYGTIKRDLLHVVYRDDDDRGTTHVQSLHWHFRYG